MPFICDTTTRSELDVAQNKLQWATILNTALGSVRHIRCKRDANASANDPWATGTEFRNVGSTGSLKIVGGKVVGLGRIKGTTIQLAADVSTGKSVVRIEGNGRWIQGTLGIGAGYDFTANGFFTATNGLALRADFALSGPVFMASGTGPVAPILDSDAPTAFRVIDYTNPASPVVAGTAQINVRDLDMVMDHPALASELGDVRVTRVADNAGVVFGTGGDAFRFSATLYSSHAGINSQDPTKPVHQVLIGARPHERWPSFPFKKDFVYQVDALAPQPFKVELLKADGSVLHVFEMYSTRTSDAPGTGKPINSPDQGSYWQTGKPFQPWWTCNMMLPWQSAKPKRHTKVNHWMPPVDATSLDWSNASAFDAGPEQYPVIAGIPSLINGMGSWRISPKWSRPRNGGLDTTTVDLQYSQPARDEYITQAIGWGHEPASIGQHIWYMSPGGVRHDRACWPDVLVRWASTPNGNRPHGNVPLEELKDAWLMNYFNEGCHYHTDLERGVSIPKSKVINGEICYNDTYYSGGNEGYRPDIENNAVRLLTIGAGNDTSQSYRDKYGRNYCNEYERDLQHSYSNAAVGVYANNSAMHAIGARHSFNSHILASFDLTNATFPKESFMHRENAWHMWQHSQMWMVTSSDSRSLSRTDVESMWERYLTAMWDSVYPAYLNDQGPYGVGLRKLGMNMALESNGTIQRVGLENDQKCFYMGIAFMFMKQTGSWDTMRAKSVKCQQILDLLVDCLCRFSVDFFMDTNGAAEGYVWFKRFDDAGVIYPGHSPDVYDPWIPVGQPVPLPLNGWTDYMQQHMADYVNQTLIRGGMGGNDTTLRTGYIEKGPGGQSQHFRAQWLWIMRDYFPERNYPRLAAAITKVDGFYAEIEATRNGVVGQWHYRYAPWGKFLPADTIGAPA
jgi:hypothetical protein